MLSHRLAWSGGRPGRGEPSQCEQLGAQLCQLLEPLAHHVRQALLPLGALLVRQLCSRRVGGGVTVHAPQVGAGQAAPGPRRV